MADVFEHCEQLVRREDRDRYLAALFAPKDRRGGLFALYAFDLEVARIATVVREPMAGEIRLQWWRGVLNGERDSEARANPVAAALLRTIEVKDLPREPLLTLLEARSFDLYDDAMPDLRTFQGYAQKTRGAILSLAARCLGASLPVSVVDSAAAALTAAGILTQAHGRGRYPATPDFLPLARENLDRVRDAMSMIEQAALSALLPLAVVRKTLARITDHAEAGAKLPALQRQWLIWRASRDPSRIA